ncbi:Putative agmatine deiminase [Raoultella terrigena]|nr:Putative agmatine deiminase [Raoultella terrigena]
MVTLEGPSTVRRADESDDFAPGYINFYLCNGAVIAPQFGDKRTDRRSRDIPQEQFADREIIQQNIDGIAAGGGIHCATGWSSAAVCQRRGEPG